MTFLNEYVSWCKSFSNIYTEINIDSSDYINLANAVGGSFARCFIDNKDNLWITTPHPQTCSNSQISIAINEYNKCHDRVRIMEERDCGLTAQNFGAVCFSVWSKVPISDLQ